MSILFGKKLVLPNSASRQIQHLKAKLEAEGAVVLQQNAVQVSADMLQRVAIDVLVLDFVADTDEATLLLERLQSLDETRTLPVFAIVRGDTGSMAEEVLEIGAADFITTLDDVAIATAKIKTILGEPNTLSASAHLIDITPQVVQATNNTTRVYFVEDDSLLRNLLETKFQESGFVCEFSTDGKQVVEKVQNFKPKVIILDIMLPGISGLEILENLKNDETTRDIPIVVFSNRDEQADRKRAEDLGASGYYVKALTDLTDLVKEVQTLAS